MTLKWFVVTSALVAGFGVYTAHAQMRPSPGVPAAKASPARAAAPEAPAPMPAASPSTSSTTGSAAPMGGYPVSSDYVIGPEDVLQVTVWKNDALSRTLPVRPDGKISMPLLHDIQAAGLTPMQLRDKIASALGEFIPNAEVAVTVNDVRSYRVSVMGEVQRPGVLLLKSSTTVLEAIAMAGGFRDFASPSKIVVVRRDPAGQTQKIPFNYNKAIRNGETEDNIVLKTGDVIVVP
jgi:polysaccharide export outer membrane protein